MRTFQGNDGRKSAEQEKKQNISDSGGGFFLYTISVSVRLCTSKFRFYGKSEAFESVPDVTADEHTVEVILPFQGTMRVSYPWLLKMEGTGAFQ